MLAQKHVYHMLYARTVCLGVWCFVECTLLHQSTSKSLILCVEACVSVGEIGTEREGGHVLQIFCVSVKELKDGQSKGLVSSSSGK